MESSELLEKIKSLIAENQIAEALDTVLKMSASKSLEKEIVLLRSQTSDVEKSFRLNLLPQDQIDRTFARIKNAILELAYTYASPVSTTEKKPTLSTAKAAALLKHGLKMKKRFEKDFTVKDAFQKYRDRMVFEPELRFAFNEVIIRDVADKTYPGTEATDKKFSPHFKSYLHDFYHNGIEFWLSGGSYAMLLVDEEDNWQHLYDTETPIPKDLNVETIKCEMYGRLPFFNIIEYTLEGDMYDDIPHIFCHFTLQDASPFESYMFRTRPNPKEKMFPFEFSPSKMKIFV